MIRTKITCDRCGKTCEGILSAKHSIQLKMINILATTAKREWDMCSKCAKEFEKTLKDFFVA